MSARLRVLIVDDEPLARENLRVLLAPDAEVELVGECASGHAALALLQERAVDLAFVDVQMPRLSGLELVQAITPGSLPLVIFVTAYDRYALDAFDAQALDYLLKPFDDERFGTALARAKSAWRQGREASMGRRLRAVVDGLEGGRRPAGGGAAAGVRPDPADPPDRLLVKQRGRLVPVDVASIDWVEAADYCVRLHVGEQTYTLRASMTALARRLGDQRFLRVHRSAIVRLDLVREVCRGEGPAWLRLADGTRLPLSRRRRLLLEQRLGS